MVAQKVSMIDTLALLTVPMLLEDRIKAGLMMYSFYNSVREHDSQPSDNIEIQLPVAQLNSAATSGAVHHERPASFLC